MAQVVDRCQNHVLSGSRVRRHYLTHPYHEEMRAAWRRLGEEIESILGCAGREETGRTRSE